jgi:hypothetical protein
MHFNLVNMVAIFPREDMQAGFSEVIETVEWGLRELGHKVTRTNNSFDTTAINIFFGGHHLNRAEMEGLPDNTIFYNLEDIEIALVRVQMKAGFFMVERFRVWDFYDGNVALWRQQKARFEPAHVPVGYAPTIARIPQRVNPAIDALFYGNPGAPRLEIIGDMARHGIRVVYACGLYGAIRDDLISQSKIVLNLGKHAGGRMFELVRVAYLLANGKAVVSEVEPRTRVDADMVDAMALVPREQITATCQRLLANDGERGALAARGLTAIKKRDVRQILRSALELQGLG